MKKVLLTILILLVLMSFTTKISTNIMNNFIDDINTSLGGTIKIQKISNNKALNSNMRALNAFLRDAKGNPRANTPYDIKISKEVIQALFIQRFGLISSVLLILLLSSFIVLPRVIKG